MMSPRFLSLDFVSAFERNRRMRPLPRRWRKPAPPIRKVWRDVTHSRRD